MNGVFSSFRSLSPLLTRSSTRSLHPPQTLHHTHPSLTPTHPYTTARVHPGDLYVTPQKRGEDLENRVVALLKLEGKRNIRQNVFVRDSNGNLSEIDIIYGYLFHTYVECKSRSDSVGLEQVAKFKEVLRLQNVPLRRGLFITNSQFVPRATTINVKTMNGKELDARERLAVVRFRRRKLLKGALSLLLAFSVLWLAYNLPVFESVYLQGGGIESLMIALGWGWMLDEKAEGESEVESVSLDNGLLGVKAQAASLIEWVGERSERASEQFDSVREKLKALSGQEESS